MELDARAQEKYQKQFYDCTKEEKQSIYNDLDVLWLEELNRSGANGVGVVFHDQGGRQNPRFCKLIRASRCFFYFQDVHHTSVNLHPNVEGYVSSTEHRLFPCWDKPRGNKPFHLRRGKCPRFRKYDENRPEIEYWYD